MDPLLVAKFFCQLLGVQPRDIQASMITLTARWAAPGVRVVPTEPVRTLQVGYDHFFYEVCGFIQPGVDDAPDIDLDDYTRVEYNISVKGDGWNNLVWDAPNNMGALFSRDGGGRARSMLPGFLHFGEKSEVQLVPSVYEFDPTWAGATRTIGVLLTGVKVASDLISEDIRSELLKRSQPAQG